MSIFSRIFGKKPKPLTHNDEFDAFLFQTGEWIFTRAMMELRYGGYLDTAYELPDDMKSAVVQYMLGVCGFIEASCANEYDIRPWLSDFRAKMMHTVFEGGPSHERALVEFTRASGGIENTYALFQHLGTEDASELMILRAGKITEDEWIGRTKLHFLAIMKTLSSADTAFRGQPHTPR